MSGFSLRAAAITRARRGFSQKRQSLLVPGLNEGAMRGFRLRIEARKRVPPQFLQHQVFAAQRMMHLGHVMATGMPVMPHAESIEVDVIRKRLAPIQGPPLRTGRFHADPERPHGRPEEGHVIIVAQTPAERLDLRRTELVGVERYPVKALTSECAQQVLAWRNHGSLLLMLL